MAINLEKNRESLKAAWKDVLNEKTDTDWAVFGYEGQTNDLKVVSTGSGGIDEMNEDLNSGKIMYAFVKVIDPKTTLPKFVLINWQGEGANIVRKGCCANHLRDVANFFTGAHVTMNARNDEEVEPQIIIDKVAKSSGSVYSFNKAGTRDVIERQHPVGTNYQRVNPVKEINAEERNQFWIREEEEERKRVEAERQRRECERAKLEAELKRRDLAEAAGRELIDEKRNANINKMRLAEANAAVLESKHQLERENERLERELVVEKLNASELLRKQRNEEAQQLIGKRTTDARHIFEQNTSAGQMMSSPVKRNSTNNGCRGSPLKVDTSKFEQAVTKIENVTTGAGGVDESTGDDQYDEQFSTIKRSPKLPSDVSAENLKNTELHGNNLKQNDNVIRKEDKLQPVIVTEQQIVDEMVYQDLGVDLGLRARALYDYQAADETEITFDPGDIITNIDQIDEGWWQGMGPDGTFGLFPANYVELIF